MSDAEDNLPSLFRSLGADNSNKQARGKLAVKDAEQRWPLLKAVAPQKADTTPRLSKEERANWVAPTPAEPLPRKAALSVPGLSDKLAAGLGKMSGRAQEAAPVRSRGRAAPSVELPSVARAQRATVARSLPEPLLPEAGEPSRAAKPGALFAAKTPPSAAKPAARNTLFPAPTAPAQSIEKAGLFKSQSEPAPSRQEAELISAARPDSLGALFGRLAGKSAAASEPVTRKVSSFLSRLGKR